MASVKNQFTTTRAPQNNHIKTRLSALGGEEKQDGKGPYFDFQFESIAAFKDYVTARAGGSGEEDEVVEVCNGTDANGGF
jgi:hypothetical protein